MRDFTPEQIAEMHDRNENFVGRTANFVKVQQYQEIKAALIDFMGICEAVHKIEEIKPNQYKQNALIYVDLRYPVVLNKASAEMLAQIMGMADSVVVSCDAEHIRYSFATEKIWTD